MDRQRIHYNDYYHDDLFGTDLMDVIYGLGGYDTLHGYGGNDKLYGGEDPDTISTAVRAVDLCVGGEGRDKLYGEEHGDQCTAAPTRIFCGAGQATMRSTAMRATTF